MAPIPTPNLSASLEQWQAYAALLALARHFGGWHKEEMRHVVMLYQRQYPGSPEDLRQAEQYAAQVRGKIQAAKAGTR